MIKLQYAHLADYAGIGANGKPLIVGIFDNVFARLRTDDGYPFPMSYAIAALSGSIVDAGEHAVELHLVDADRKGVWEPIRFDSVPFRPTGEGRPTKAIVATFIAGLTLPAIGDYEFLIRVDGAPVGDLPFSLLPDPASGAA